MGWKRLCSWSCLLALSGCAVGAQSGDLDAGSSPATAADAAAVSDAASADSAPAVELDAGSAADAAAELDAETVEVDAGDLCAATTSCGSAAMLGSMSGDKGTAMLSVSGAGTGFYAVQVSEDDHGLLGVDLSVRGVLNSPSSANFDLYVYAEGDGCATATDSAKTEFDDIVTAGWGDGRGGDSGRLVIFEVRHVSGTCDSTLPWKLDVGRN